MIADAGGRAGRHKITLYSREIRLPSSISIYITLLPVGRYSYRNNLGLPGGRSVEL